MDFLYIMRELHVKNCLHFMRVSLYTLVVDHKSQKIASSYAKNVFFGVKLHAILPKDEEHLLYVHSVFLIQCAFDCHIVNIHLYGLLDEGLKYLVCQSLASRSHVLKPKKHDYVTILCLICNEGYIFLASLIVDGTQKKCL